MRDTVEQKNRIIKEENEEKKKERKCERKETIEGIKERKTA